MDHSANIALLRIMQQDVSGLSIDALCELYHEALHQASDAERRYKDTHREDAVSFD